MKALILILIIYINYVLSDDVHSNPKFAVKKYPKKVLPGHVQIILGKYVKPQTKKPGANKDYTAFAQIHENTGSNVPNSQYFPSELIVEQKPRVKKVLQDYSGVASRSKRSVKNDEPKRNKEVKKPDDIYTVKSKKSILRSRPQRKGDKHKRTGRKGKVARSQKQKTSKNVGKAVRNGESHKRGKKQRGRILKASRRLIAGRDAMIEEYPYVVSIQKDEDHWCAGALLNPRLVITTANCLWKANRMSRMEIRAGSRHTNRGGQVARISEVMKHPGWGIRRDPDCDVALVLLDRNFKFSNSIHSVDLPNRVMMPPFDDAWITSWGADRRDGVYDPPPQSLQVYHARLIDHDKCNNVTQRFGVTVNENFICLAQTGRKSPCTRDTGAPAVSDGVLWGLASWGIRKLCGTERFPAVFSYIGSQANMDFIMNATRVLMADERHYPFLDRYPILKSGATNPTAQP